MTAPWRVPVFATFPAIGGSPTPIAADATSATRPRSGGGVTPQTARAA